MNGNPDTAWNLYICVENHIIAVNILNYIAHEFYKHGHFYNAFKSFLFLEKFAPTIENYNGKVASAVGTIFSLISRCILSSNIKQNRR